MEHNERQDDHGPGNYYGDFYSSHRIELRKQMPIAQCSGCECITATGGLRESG